jgi:hypothetical protein
VSSSKVKIIDKDTTITDLNDSTFGDGINAIIIRTESISHPVKLTVKGSVNFNGSVKVENNCYLTVSGNWLNGALTNFGATIIKGHCADFSQGVSSMSKSILIIDSEDSTTKVEDDFKVGGTD